MTDADAALPAAEVRSMLDGLLDDYRTALHDSLDGLTEDEARASLAQHAGHADILREQVLARRTG